MIRQKSVDMKVSTRPHITRYRTKEELKELRSHNERIRLPETSFNPLSISEETLLLSYYQKEVVDYFIKNNTKVSFPTSVYSSACYFIRIFYLKSSIYKYDPLFVCYLCFYIAAKVEHHYMSISTYLKMLPDRYKNYREDFVLKEVEVLKHMNFELNHSSVFAAIDGLLLQYEFYMNHKASDSDKKASPYFSSENLGGNDDNGPPRLGDISANLFISKIRNKARIKAFFIITTDLILIHPAAQLAAALLVEDIGAETLSKMMACFMETRENADIVEKHTTSYFTKIVAAKEAIAHTEKTYSINWKELVRRYKKTMIEISKN